MSDIDLLQLATMLGLGIGLSAACGFRIFLPMLAFGSAAKAGLYSVSEGWEWLASWPAIIVLAVATTVEIGAYFVPWIDNALDSIGTVAAVLAGTALMAAMLTELDPMWQWSLAAIAGGGSAGTIKGGMGLTRAASTATTGGMANPLVSLVELMMSGLMSLLALVLPIVAGIVAILIVVVMLRIVWKLAARLGSLRRGRRETGKAIEPRTSDIG